MPKWAGQHFDYVICGAGSAGCVLANRLSEDRACNVLLLEAGGANRSVTIEMPAALALPMRSARYNWQYRSEREPGLDHRRLACPRGKGLGGSSAINGMVYVRGHALDFEGWELPGWGYPDVLPYFKRSEGARDQLDDGYRGLSGPLTTRVGRPGHPLHEAFLSAAAEAGYARSDNLNGFRQEGFGALPMTVAGGRRCSAKRAYLEPAQTRHNLVVITGALVERLVFENRRCRRVEWRRGGRTEWAEVDREAILCAGAIGTPTVLQRSGVGAAAALAELGIAVVADLPGVGANLMDHLEIYQQYACRADVTLHPSLTVWGKALIGARWLLTRRGLGSTNHFEVGGFIRSGAGTRWPDIQFHFLAAAMRYDGTAVAARPGCQAHIGPMRPESRGFVTLSDPQPSAPPRIQFRYLEAEHDRAVFRRAVRLTRELFAQPALARYVTAEQSPGAEVSSDDEIDAFVRAEAESAYHPCGTARMGAPDDNLAVTDTAGRVRTLAGVRVIDASLFPVIPNGNLNAPTIMTAEKIAAEMTGTTLPPCPLPYYEAEEWQTAQRA